MKLSQSEQLPRDSYQPNKSYINIAEMKGGRKKVEVAVGREEEKNGEVKETEGKEMTLKGAKQ